ncbi:hypothetical protein D3C84_1057390 [compost metagenome]
MGLFPTGESITDLHVRQPTRAHLFDQVRSDVIGQGRFESLQTLRQDRSTFSLRNWR